MYDHEPKPGEIVSFQVPEKQNPEHTINTVSVAHLEEKKTND